ncbi:MAG: dihydroorotate dehydrogenase-like protein [Planctomycetota bacterium]
MDLSTDYLGLTLKNPLVVSSCPLSATVDNVRQMEDAGAGAVVLYSLFEEQIRHEDETFAHYMDYGTETFPEALDFFPDPGEYRTGPSDYLEHVRACKAAVDVPIIGSINGTSDEGWIQYAKEIQSAGADALELNVYYLPTASGHSSGEVEQRYLDVLKEVKANVSIPVSVKLSPYFSALGDMAERLVAGGADGLVLFNRFYQPDFDLEELEVLSRVQLSNPGELRLPLLWIGALSGRIDCSLAATTGIHSGRDLAKAVLAGAHVGMSASAILARGIKHLAAMRADLESWMTEKEYESVKQMRGAMNMTNVHNTEAFRRANYIKMLTGYEPEYMNGP